MNIDKVLAEIHSQGITLLDVGSSGHPSPRWSSLAPWINLIGFDPNEEECNRLARLDLGYRNSEYLPVALGMPGATAELQITRDPYCISLLSPNHAWLDRFTFGDHFEVIDRVQVTTAGIDAVLSSRPEPIDIMKLDAQGAELQILAWSEKTLASTFAVEIESGFIENYLGESTFERVSAYLKERNFLMFDINSDHRVARRNRVGETLHGGEQILWCESLWLRDLVAEARVGRLDIHTWPRRRALSTLAICWSSNCPDFGLEIAEMFVDLEILNSGDIAELRATEGWHSLATESNGSTASGSNEGGGLLGRAQRVVKSLASRTRNGF